jgi:hypothetical protein
VTTVKRPRPRYPPVECLIEGCRATTTTVETLRDGRYLETDSGEAFWVCSKHWKRVPRYMKRRRRLLIRLWRKYNPSGKFWDYAASFGLRG